MSLNAGKLLRETYDYLGQVNYSRVTGTQATNAITDTSIVDKYPDDAWDAIFISAVTLDAAPQDQFARVSAFDAATGIFTLLDPLTIAPPDESSYGFVSSLYPVETIFNLINPALKMIGYLPVTCAQGFTSDQKEYDLPTAVTKFRPVKVEYQVEVGVGEPWFEISDYRVTPGYPTAVGKIYLPNPPTGTGRITYMAEHADVEAYDDDIHEMVDETLAIYALALKSLEWQIGRTQGAEDYVKDEYNKVVQKFQDRLLLHAPEEPVEQPQLFIAGMDDFLSV
jgi:hypothetical protein